MLMEIASLAMSSPRMDAPQLTSTIVVRRGVNCKGMFLRKAQMVKFLREIERLLRLQQKKRPSQ